MLASIVICTRNRAAILRQALRSLADCLQPDERSAWEVIVVDNASSDDTQSVADEFRTQLPLRYVHEAEPGLSNARNRGVSEARGTWILWIDDDVTVTREWLRAYLTAMHSHSDADVLGGPIIVELDGDPPHWLREGVEWVLDAFAGKPPSELHGRFYSSGPKPYGANFALRTAAARSVPFDPALGRHPLRPTMGGEETEVIRQMLDHGSGWWVPDAVVFHHIDGTRQTARYLDDYFTAAGSQSARSWRQLPGWLRLRKLATAIRRACTNHVRYLLLCLVHDRRHRARALRYAAWNRGYVGGCLKETFARGSSLK
jgi:glycosyltransferase involved in cell wall biosynthesis